MARCVVVDVTTLNFNLLFEVGYALGLEMSLLPIRDTSFIRDKQDFDQLGLLDTIGYLDFQNSQALTQLLEDALPGRAIPATPSVLNRQAPLYVVKPPIATEGPMRLMSILKKSPLRFRTFDVDETPRLSLHDARKHVGTSLGIVAHLLGPDRKGARLHNARCAVIAGMAMATGKLVLLLEHGYERQPIDYRDVIRSYAQLDQIAEVVEPLIRAGTLRLQEDRVSGIRRPRRLLERVDLGDIAAENEISALREYFVQTSQYNEARRGQGRLITGRKGSGKTAIFYAVREDYWRRRSHVVLDLKPEGHQFTKLHEAILNSLTPGLRDHTLTAFWHYILLCELAHKILEHDYSWAERLPDKGGRHTTSSRTCTRNTWKAPRETSQSGFWDRWIA